MNAATGPTVIQTEYPSAIFDSILGTPCVVSHSYEAEEEHQQFYKKDPKRMEFEESQGRKQFIEENWGI